MDQQVELVGDLDANDGYSNILVQLIFAMKVGYLALLEGLPGFSLLVGYSQPGQPRFTNSIY